MASYNQNVIKFNEQKTSWENAIHLYKGPDPLEYWYHYVNWYEQNYCYDATNQMSVLLQKALSQFNNINAYKQDHRMVKLWLKYVELQPNPLNIFQNLYQRGIGTQLSFFYIAWANSYLKENDFKLAESAINWGFQAQAKPLEDLQSAQQQVANSYYDYTQQRQQRTGPYQIVIQQMSPGNQQPPLPAQVATNYQTNPSYSRDKRKLEDTFPVHSVGGGPVKRSRPNEEYNNNPAAVEATQYMATGVHYNAPTHYAQAPPSPKGVYSQPQNNYAPQQHYPNCVENGKGMPTNNLHNHSQSVPSSPGNLHHAQQHPHHQGNVMYQQQQPQQQPNYVQQQTMYAPETYSGHHQQQNGHPNYHPQQHHPHPHQLPPQPNHHPQPPPGQQIVQQPEIVYHQTPATNYPAGSISNGDHQQRVVVNSDTINGNGDGAHPPHHQQQHQVVQQTSNGYEDLNNSRGYVIASSLNYVYEEYNPNMVVEEVVVMDQPHQQPTMSQAEEHLPSGINIPEDFSRIAKNSHNIWRAPLFLEEPFDQNRRPMYIKDRVYPVTGTEESGRCELEYSFEELRKSARLAAASQAGARGQVTSTTVVDPDTYEEYWTEETAVQGEEDVYSSSQGSTVISGRLITAADNAYGEYVPEQVAENGGNVYYHVMEPKSGQKKVKSSKRKGKRKKNLIVQINDDSDEEEDDDDENGEGDGYDYCGGDEETTTIRYTCDQNGLNGGGGGSDRTGGAGGPGGGGEVRRITIKLRKQVTTATKEAGGGSKVPFGNNGRNGGGSNNGYATTGFYRRTATDADADLLLSLGNGQSGYYQEMKPTAVVAGYNEDSSSYSEYNASYNSSYLGGDNSNTSTAGTDPSPMHSFQHNQHLRTQTQSISATSTPHITPAYRRLTKHRSNVSLMNDDSMSSTMNENSFFQGELDEEVKSRRLAKAVATVEEHFAKKSIDPFNAELCKALLTKIGFPSAELCDVYRMVQHPLPKLSNTKQALLGDTYYNVEKEVGRGTYGAVYKAANVYTGATVAIKFQKPANSWELYICNEIKKRIKYHDILPGFMDITSAVLAPNGCVLISEFSPYGSLLDINNKIRQATTRVMHESLAMHFTSQILDIIHYLHGCQIIHADIKPDNFLIMKVPNSSSHVPTVRLIDFGCAIDMTMFPEDTRFKKVIQTEGFTCSEMKENRPWTYQTDLYCVAATAHVMLFGEYMQVVKKFGVWEIKQKLPRYLKKHVWVQFFNKLLNIPDCDELPNLQELKAAIDNEGYAMENELQKHIRTLSNLLFKR